MDFLFRFADYLNFIDEEYYQELIKNRKILKKSIWERLKNRNFGLLKFRTFLNKQVFKLGKMNRFNRI